MKKKQQGINGSLMEILRTTGLGINDKDELSSLIGKGIDDIAAQDQRKYGLRTESMFAYMAGALGNCELIKQEDGNGICLVADDTLGIPDYRVVLKDKETFFAEVKNCANTSLTFKEHYIKDLQKYADLNGIPLKIAVYWNRIKTWTLVSPDWFVFENGKYVLDLGKAMAMSEMAKLGDFMIGTKPPLVLRLVMDDAKTSKIDANNQCLFTIGDVQIFSGGELIVDKIEKDIAFQLILSGQWQEEDRAKIENDKVAYIEYEYTPLEINEAQGFNLVGFLSSVISEKYNAATARNGEVERLSPQQGPEQFQVYIPEDYKGNVLHLWRLVIQPNQDYQTKVA
jgi:Holliday junction resolvase